jgi:hypothetical protein
MAQYYLSATRGNATGTLHILLFPFALMLVHVFLFDMVHSAAEVKPK